MKFKLLAICAAGLVSVNAGEPIEIKNYTIFTQLEKVYGQKSTVEQKESELKQESIILNEEIKKFVGLVPKSTSDVAVQNALEDVKELNVKKEKKQITCCKC